MTHNNVCFNSTVYFRLENHRFVDKTLLAEAGNRPFWWDYVGHNFTTHGGVPVP